jgi:hypothetical protein
MIANGLLVPRIAMHNYNEKMDLNWFLNYLELEYN